MIEVTEHFQRDDKGKRIPESSSAHVYCEPCNMNYGSRDIAQVMQVAEAHAIRHGKPFKYVPDPVFDLKH